MLEDDARDSQYQDYSATCLWMIGKALCGDKWQIPSFVDMMYPSEEKTNDKRNSGDIVRDLMERLNADAGI